MILMLQTGEGDRDQGIKGGSICEYRLLSPVLNLVFLSLARDLFPSAITGGPDAALPCT